MRKLIWVVVIVLVAIFTFKYYLHLTEKPPVVKERSLLAEQFIQQYLMQSDGLISTDLSSRQSEYLSETVGLWMEYLVLQNDQRQFDEQVKVLKKYFLTRDELVAWEVKGTKRASANAFIDDLRIMNALYDAGENWSIVAYSRLAEKMEKSLIRYHVQQNVFVDFVELGSKNFDTKMTLSYLIPAGLDKIRAHTKDAYNNSRSLLVDAPIDARGFFPKVYDVETGNYSFDTEVNMIDQLYVGYHRAQWQGDVEPLLEFVRKQYGRDGKIYGRYDSATGEPLVGYESVAVYALGILLAVEVDEQDLARELYGAMKVLQQDDETLPYYGGYVDVNSGDTHTFDNLLALIAERKGIYAGIF